MYFSSFFNKKIYFQGHCKGVCVGIFLSKKTKFVKYLACRDNGTIFALPFSNVDYVTDVIRLKKFSVSNAASCDLFRTPLPVFDDEGRKLGETIDLETENQRLLSLSLDNKTSIPAALLLSCKDAVIVKKTPPFPLSRRIPARAKDWLNLNSDEKFVTKKTLSKAAEQGTLVRFTLSLLPSFSLNGVL